MSTLFHCNQLEEKRFKKTCRNVPSLTARTRRRRERPRRASVWRWPASPRTSPGPPPAAGSSCSGQRPRLQPEIAENVRFNSNDSGSSHLENKHFTLILVSKVKQKSQFPSTFTVPCGKLKTTVKICLLLIHFALSEDKTILPDCWCRS